MTRRILKASWANGRGKLAIAVCGAVAAGLIAGKAWQMQSATIATPSSSAIEWNSVQPVPTRQPDAADLAWERRAQELDAQVARPARAPAEGPQFGYCYSGGGTDCVVDGDTFYLNGEKVRIAGIDAPETHPPRCDYEARLGNQATEKLHSLLNSGTVTMTGIDRDRDVYGRLLRNVQVNGEDVGQSMISAGLAREYGRGRRPWC